MADRNDPEEWRENERLAQKLSAQISETMMRHPGSRWVLRPLRRFSKWLERLADQWLKDEGWR